MSTGSDDAAKQMLVSLQSNFDTDEDLELSRLQHSDNDDDDEVTIIYYVSHACSINNTQVRSRNICFSKFFDVSLT